MSENMQNMLHDIKLALKHGCNYDEKYSRRGTAKISNGKGWKQLQEYPKYCSAKFGREIIRRGN